MSRLTRFVPHLAAAFAGFAVMSLELLGSRLVAPALGSSILIWTNLIGVILLALALGAWLGGKYADRLPDRRLVAGLLFGAGLWSAGLATASRFLMVELVKFSPEVAAPLASLVLLAVPAALLGAVPPVVLRLSVKDVEHSGQVAGLLSALGTIGSLVGTYVTGYILLPRFRVSELLLGLSYALASAAFLIVFPALRKRHATVGAVMLAVVSQTTATGIPGAREYPSAYAYVASVNLTTPEGPATSLMINTGFHAAATVAQPTVSVLDYVRAMRVTLPLLPVPRRALALGGGGFHVIRDVLSAFPESTVDVVEIDPAVERVSKDIFGLVDDSRLHIFSADARTDIRTRPSAAYDLLIQDAYGGDTSVPWHLMTREAFADYARVLSPDGLFTANVIMPTAPQTGSAGEVFSKDFFATARTAFSWMFAVSVMNASDVQKPSNVIFFAGNGTMPDPNQIEQAIQQELPDHPVRLVTVLSGGRVWTDDFGPADFESMRMYQESRRNK